MNGGSLYNPVKEDEIIPPPAAAVGVLEGNYFNWGHLHTITYSNTVLGWVSAAHKIDDIREILYVMWRDAAADDRMASYNIRTGALIFMTVLGLDYILGAPAGNTSGVSTDDTHWNKFANRNRYVGTLLQATPSLDIWKDGVIIQNIDVGVLFGWGWIDQVYMGRNGKWLLIQFQNMLAVFEGI